MQLASMSIRILNLHLTIKMSKFATFLSIFALLASVLHQAKADEEAPLKNGFYKIESLVDSLVLTATWNGRPRAVITDAWNQLSTQEWRIRTQFYEHEPLEIIRNEIIKDNEVAKEEGPDKPGRKLNLVPIEWNFIPVPDKADTFVLNSGTGCVKNNGVGQRITFEDCDDTSVDQQWHFEYLFEKL